MLIRCVLVVAGSITTYDLIGLILRYSCLTSADGMLSDISPEPALVPGWHSPAVAFTYLGT